MSGATGAVKRGLPGPLAGIRVLDLTSFLGGPYAGMLLADLGADVIKVEAPPGGDPSRNRQDHVGYSSTYAGVNRNKRSVVLDLKNPEARPLLHALIKRCDVILLSIRPKSRPGLGLDYESLRAINPRLIYCSITGYGESPEARDRPAFDTTAQALSGLLSLVLGSFDREVTIRAFLSDILAGVYACNGVLAAIVARTETGEGQEVRTSLLEASLAFEVFNFFTLFAAQAANREHTSVRPAGYLLRGSDGKPFAVHVPPSPEHIWHNFITALGLPWLDEDQRFKSKAARAANYPELHRIVADHVHTAPRAHWTAKLAEREVACAPIYALDEVFDDPLVQGLGMLHTFIDPWGKEQKTVGSGVKLSGFPPMDPRRAPLLGEHNRSVLSELGLPGDEIERLERIGVIGAPDPLVAQLNGSGPETAVGQRESA